MSYHLYLFHPYSQDSEEAIFEPLMTASEINDTYNFGIYNPQERTWKEE